MIKQRFLPQIFWQTDRSKLWARSDAAFCGVWSKSTLFATHQAILDTFTYSDIDLWILLEVHGKELHMRIFLVNTVTKIYHAKCPMKIKF